MLHNEHPYSLEVRSAAAALARLATPAACRPVTDQSGTRTAARAARHTSTDCRPSPWPGAHTQQSHTYTKHSPPNARPVA